MLIKYWQSCKLLRHLDTSCPVGLDTGSKILKVNPALIAVNTIMWHFLDIFEMIFDIFVQIFYIFGLILDLIRLILDISGLDWRILYRFYQ